MGIAVQQVAEASTTSIEFPIAGALVPSDVLVVEYSSVAWDFVDEFSTVVGVNLTHSAITLGDTKSLFYKNGLLMYNSTDADLGVPAMRYQENITTSSILEAGSLITDVWQIFNKA